MNFLFVYAYRPFGRPCAWRRSVHPQQALQGWRRVACALTFLALSVFGSGCVAAMPTPAIARNPTPVRGLLLLSPSSIQFEGQILDLATGKRVDLPRSARGAAQGGRDDTWSVSRATRELIREDGAEGVDILAWPSLALNHSFKLATETRPDEKARLLSLEMSPDGRYLAAREFARSSSRKDRVLIFDRQGQILLAGPYQDPNTGGGGFAWLPDGRLVYFDQGELKTHDLKLGQSSVVPVQYPFEVKAGSEDLAVSPDGLSVAINKWTTVRSSQGEPRKVNVIFRVGIGGGPAILLAHPTQQRVDDPLRMVMMDLSWSADGQWLAFAARVGDDRYGGGLGNGGCPYVYAVPATANVAAQIDGILDSEKAIHVPSAVAGRVPVVTCRELRWF